MNTLQLRSREFLTKLDATLPSRRKVPQELPWHLPLETPSYDRYNTNDSKTRRALSINYTYTISILNANVYFNLNASPFVLCFISPVSSSPKHPLPPFYSPPRILSIVIITIPSCHPFPFPPFHMSNIFSHLIILIRHQTMSILLINSRIPSI
jgi:hypothetical protein